MSSLPDQGSGPRVPRQAQPPPYATERFVRFLDRSKVAVLDVVRGASPDSRRLLVGNPKSGSVSHAVAVAHRGTKTTAIDTEHDVLVGIGDQLRLELVQTVPRVVDRVEVTSTQTGLVVTGVRGLKASVAGPGEVRTSPMLAAVDSWLAAVWQDTAGDSVQVDLGGEATNAVLTRYSGSARLAPALGQIERARGRLAQFQAPRTLTHGCLCPRHTKTDDEAVVGVDDWGLASLAADPLRDLGRFAVRVADARLPEVVAGRTSYAGAVRSFVSSGLDRTGLPRHLWRDVLVLTQLELAMEALDRGDPDRIALLITAVRELPAQRGRNEARSKWKQS